MKRFVVQLVTFLIVTVPALGQLTEQCAAAEQGARAGASFLVSTVQLQPADVETVAGAEIAGIEELRNRFDVDSNAEILESFPARSRLSVTADGLEYEAFSFLDVSNERYRGLLLYSPVPKAVRDALQEQGTTIPYSAMMVESGATPQTVRMTMVGRGPAVEFSTSDLRPAEHKAVEATISGGCVDCVKGLLGSAACEAIAVGLSCATYVGCPGAVMSLMVKAAVQELVGSACSSISLASCLAQCAAPTITLTPGSNTSFAPSTIRLGVTATGGGSQIGTWVAVLNGVRPVFVDSKFGSSNTFDWQASAGTYRVIGGNIPGANLSWPPTIGMPWLKVSSNIVVASSNATPIARFSFTTSGLTAQFRDESTDSDGTIVSRSWNFGDGTSSNATNPSRTYTSSGTKNVMLTVTDNGGKSASVTHQVTVSSSSTCSGRLYTGSLASGGGVVQPNGTYYTTTRSGTHNGKLTGPSTADFDLYLYRWTGSAWGLVASSRSSSSSESISYYGASGHYYWLVTSFRGSGSYSLCLQTP